MTGWTRGPGGTGRAWTRGKRVGEKLGPVKIDKCFKFCHKGKREICQ